MMRWVLPEMFSYVGVTYHDAPLTLMILALNGKEPLVTERKPGFDFPALKNAFEREDAEFHAEDDEWIEARL